ncbi:MAG: hypothetical protein AAF481_06125 [Acidobacteriota bacterium]
MTDEELKPKVNSPAVEIENEGGLLSHVLSAGSAGEGLAPWIVRATLRDVVRLSVIALACFALYGALAGFFEPGGGQVFIATLKATLIGAGALFLCIPSFIVFHRLGEVHVPSRAFAPLLAGYAAFTGLVLLALGPILWLFSVSSRSLGFVVFFHALLWTLVALLGARFLFRSLGNRAAVGPILVWSAMFGLVVLQLVAYLGPVLVRQPEEALFPLEKGSFLVRFVEAGEYVSGEGQ